MGLQSGSRSGHFIFGGGSAQTRIVEGIVRDEKTKTVMKDVGVWSFGFASSNTIGIMTFKTYTDAEGRFHMAGLPKGDGNKLLIVPNDDQPFFMQNVAVPDPPGIGAISIEINLHKGIWIEGKLIRIKKRGPLSQGPGSITCLSSITSLSRRPPNSGAASTGQDLAIKIDTRARRTGATAWSRCPVERSSGLWSIRVASPIVAVPAPS